MPSRAALRVIKRYNDDGQRHTTCGHTSEEEAVMGAYRTLAEEMGATIELTLDGQVILYTGYFKPSLQGYVDLYHPNTLSEG